MTPRLDPRIRKEGLLERLARTLSTDADRHREALAVTVEESCGSVEVRVAGANACLRLSFDRADLHPAQVRQAVRQAVARYRSALAAQAGASGKE